MLNRFGVFCILFLSAVPGIGQITITNVNYTLYIHESGRVAHMQIPTSEYTNWVLGTISSTDMRAMTSRMYDHFEDAFDMIFFQNNINPLQAGYYGRHYSAQNDISGLGKSIFDSTSQYGSDGQLQSAIHLSQDNGLSGGPSLHEITHRWANSMNSVPTTVGGHWGFSNVGGQLGGWKPGTLQDLGGGNYDADGVGGGSSFGTFANGGNGVPYSLMELYVMGLIPAADMTQDIKIATNPVYTDSSQGQFTADSILTRTIGDIEATDGVRVPAFGASQTNFRSLLVILDDMPLSTATWDRFDDDANDFGLSGDDGSSLYNFWEATGGRAHMQMDDLFSVLKPGNEFLTIIETGTLQSQGFEGGPFSPSNMVYTLSNSFPASITWTAQTSAVWLDFSLNGGVLPAGGTVQVSVWLSSNVNALASGRYETQALFVNAANGISAKRDASLFVASIATMPFTEDFESGEFAAYWTSTGTAEYRTEITTELTPHGGSYHLAMDDRINGGLSSRNEVTLTINLAGYTNLSLSFWIREEGDENDTLGSAHFIDGADFDGVAISENGSDWYVVQNLINFPSGVYTQQIIDLDAAMATHGLNLSDRFQIRFNHYDNFAFNSDGFLFDDIEITGNPLDSDADGMPDPFELAYGLNPTNAADAAEDADGDQSSNLDEYFADTHPTNGLSFLGIESISRESEYEWSVRFNTSSRRVYRLEAATTLLPPNWMNVETNVMGTGSAMDLTHSNANDRVYYRVGVDLPRTP